MGFRQEALSHEYLLSILEYKDGNLIWKDEKKYRMFGKVAGTLHPRGYIHIIINGVLFKAHRLIWFYHYKEWPKHTIDHINRIKTDNRIENLRDLSMVDNFENVIKANKNNSTGLRGVSKVKCNKFRAVIIKNKIKYHIGHFDSPEEAHNAYLNYKKILHPLYEQN